MPTPVNTARECLTEEAARALDDAVAIARRRSHAQTTSLHAVSALLAMPSSLLREVCVSRAARSTPYSSRLQFRALELCVGVSLDRLPSSSSKSSSGEEDPPAVSNSLMAAIKRSQANQRRHPEAYHLHQMHGGCQTTTVLKVELKYFVLSILDDPIVNRVFCDAGFRSSDIKLDVLHPPVTTISEVREEAQNAPVSLNITPEPVNGQAQLAKPIQPQVSPAQQTLPTDTLQEDKNRVKEEKQRAKQMVMSCTASRCGPELRNSFAALGSIGECR